MLNAAVLGRGRLEDAHGWILAGGLLPDLAMFVFVGWYAFVLGEAPSQIFGVEYFRPGWQLTFDLMNSIPLASAGLALAWWRGSARWSGLFASVILHCLLDLPLHHDDGHRHFLPLSDWRFESPVSYWDAAHLGWLGAGIEAALATGAGVVLALRARQRWIGAGLAVLGSLHLLVYVTAYAL